MKSRVLKYYNLARYELQPTTSTMDPMANVGKYISPMDGMGMAVKQKIIEIPKYPKQQKRNETICSSY